MGSRIRAFLVEKATKMYNFLPFCGKRLPTKTARNCTHPFFQVRLQDLKGESGQIFHRDMEKAMKPNYLILGGKADGADRVCRGKRVGGREHSKYFFSVAQEMQKKR
jgi:hypothetical protein